MRRFMRLNCQYPRGNNGRSDKPLPVGPEVQLEFGSVLAKPFVNVPS